VCCNVFSFRIVIESTANSPTANDTCFIGLYDINWIAQNAELRIAIGEKEFLGKGVGTDVTIELVKYGFEKLNLHKIYLGVNASDKRANKCYQKVGFVYEGKIRDYHYRNGRYYDANLYSILKKEFYNKSKNRSSEETSKICE